MNPLFIAREKQAKSIIEKQNGYIKVESKKGNGTTFILQFYKNIL